MLSANHAGDDSPEISSRQHGFARLVTQFTGAGKLRQTPFGILPDPIVFDRHGIQRDAQERLRV